MIGEYEAFNVQQGNSSDEEKGSSSLSSPQIRKQFLVKVYSILLAQFGLTALMCAISMGNQAWLNFQVNNTVVLIIVAIASIVILLTLACNQKLAREVPKNYILLGLFTVCEGYLISMICGLTPNPSNVLIAAFLTMALFFGLTLYACTTKDDFTAMGAFLYVCCIVMLVAGLILMFFESNTAHVIYDCFGVLLFSIYIIYDTQLILGNGKYSLEIDDYVFAALNLYIDVVQIFLYILDILNRSSSN